MTENSTTPEKQCSKCKKVFPRTTEYFYADKRKRDGLRSCCKNCFSTQVGIWQKENPEKVYASAKKYRQNNPERARQWVKKWRKANLERARAHDKKWAQTHPEQERASRTRWVRANPEKIRIEKSNVVRDKWVQRERLPKKIYANFIKFRMVNAAGVRSLSYGRQKRLNIFVP